MTVPLLIDEKITRVWGDPYYVRIQYVDRRGEVYHVIATYYASQRDGFLLVEEDEADVGMTLEKGDPVDFVVKILKDEDWEALVEHGHRVVVETNDEDAAKALLDLRQKLEGG